jgi:hypothetical protein
MTILLKNNQKQLLMKNNLFNKKPKTAWIALLVLFFGLFVNEAMGQITYTWNGSASTTWTDPANWTPSAGASYPGTVATDIVVIDSNVPTNAPTVTGTQTIASLTVSNAFGTTEGATLTIAGTLNVTGSGTTVVTLKGGNIINDGTLNVTNTATTISSGIVCATPTQPPLAATNFGYTGSGGSILSVNVSACTAANSGGFSNTSLGVNTTYRLLFDGTTTFSLATASVASYAIRGAGGLAASPLIIGGTGFSIAGTNGGLISLGAQSTVTVNSGTTLTMNSAATNVTRGIVSFSGSANVTTFTNNGTINILGSSTVGGIFYSVGAGGAIVPFTTNNSGTININLDCSGVITAPLGTGNGGGIGAAGTMVNLNNTGTLILKNTSLLNGRGAAIFGFAGGEAPPMTITNSGTMNIEGSSYNYGSKISIVNNGFINSNNAFTTFTIITNNATGIFSFVKTAATATTRQVTFNGVLAATTSGALGSTFEDTNGNVYAVVVQKFTTGTTLVANVLSGATVVTSGTLTRKTGTGVGTMSYTSVTIPSLNNALPFNVTNGGTINTGTGSDLNVITGVTTSSTSIIAPGGAAGKGIADFAKSGAVSLTGKTILQIAGDATAGVDYDKIINSSAGDLTVGGTLDITGIYTPAGPVTIEIIKATGNLIGNFGTVIGITTGWSVVPTAGAAGKIELVYATPTSNTRTWIGTTSAGWITSTNWQDGLVPDQNSVVTIATGGTFQPSSFVNINIKSLTIDAGSSLQINSGYNLTVKEAIVNNGTLTLASNANLIQVDDVVNSGSGNITVNRNSNALSRLDYTIWSSPMTNLVPQLLSAFSPATDSNRFYTYNQTTNLYNAVDATATPFAEATGYLIRMPNDHPTSPTIWNGSFSGVPNNGNISKAVTYLDATHGYNMIGNPYPSTIDAQAFITANTANIESSLYFWRKINGATGSAYAVYNPMGSTTATPTSALPNGTIQVGQGFFVKAKSASSVNFTNEMRVANNQNQFFKTRAAQKDRLWVNLTNVSGVYSQALVGYTADAITGVDMYDAKFINDSKVALTSNINGEEFTIQGRPAFDASDVVALNFKTDTAGDYTIALDQFDGVFASGQDIYLLDSKTGIETDLKVGSYTFAAVADKDNARFSLRYQKTLKVNAPAFNENSVSVYKNNGTLYVNAGSVIINSIEVYDVQGRLLASQRNVKATTASINNLRASNQVLIVKIAGVDNSVVTKKVVN